jgi:hypothetical protein
MHKQKKIKIRGILGVLEKKGIEKQQNNNNM